MGKILSSLEKLFWQEKTKMPKSFKTTDLGVKKLLSSFKILELTHKFLYFMKEVYLLMIQTSSIYLFPS